MRKKVEGQGGKGEAGGRSGGGKGNRKGDERGVYEGSQTCANEFVRTLGFANHDLRGGYVGRAITLVFLFYP